MTARHRNRARIPLALAGLAFAIAVAVVVLLLPSSTDPGLPAAIAAASPAVGERVGQMSSVGVVFAEPVSDVSVFVDGFPITADEIVREGDSYTWAPGPGRLYETWPLRGHTVELRWADADGSDRSHRWMFIVEP